MTWPSRMEQSVLKEQRQSFEQILQSFRQPQAALCFDMFENSRNGESNAFFSLKLLARRSLDSHRHEPADQCGQPAMPRWLHMWQCQGPTQRLYLVYEELQGEFRNCSLAAANSKSTQLRFLPKYLKEAPQNSVQYSCTARAMSAPTFLPKYSTEAPHNSAHYSCTA